MRDAGQNGRANAPALRVYRLATHVLTPIAPLVLKRRLKRGKELPGRWREKLGHASQPRPQGQLVWLHAVGLGEALALRALIEALESQRPGLNILVTTGTRGSAEALARNGIGGAIHQFLPLDLPGARRRFFEHWHPDLAVWSEQDVWPGLVAEAAARGIPQVWINARMNAEAQHRRARSKALYRAVYGCFQFISAQDAETARHIASFGATAGVDGSLKPAAAPLADDPDSRDALRRQIGARRIWLAASSHAADEAVALDALQQGGGDDLLILAPRYVERAEDIVATCRDSGLTVARRSVGQVPDADTQVYLADTLGEMGIWYRLADASLIGGSFDAIEGHNPWEAAALNCAILHGPRTANFVNDYRLLDGKAAARPVAGGADVAAALRDPTLSGQVERAAALVIQGRQLVEKLATRLLAELEARGAQSE